MGGDSQAALTFDPQVVTRLKAASRAAAVALLVVASAVLCGWLFHWQFLISLSSRYAPMKPNTALGLLGTGAALWMFDSNVESRRSTGRRLACAVLLLGGLTLAEYLFNWDPGFDRLLYGGGDPGRWPARMSIGSASHFVLLGCALLLQGRHSGRAAAAGEWLTLLVALSSFAVLLSYTYGVDSLYASKLYSSMALHTAVAFLLAGFGILFARPEQGVMRIVSSSGPGGQLARRLLPAIVLVPALLGWLRVKAQNAGLFGTGFGTAVFVASCMLCLSTLVVSTAKALQVAHLERRRAELKLQEGENNLAVTLKSIGDGVITTDLEGLVTGMNPVATELTGWPLEEAVGKPLATVFQSMDEDTGEPFSRPPTLGLSSDPGLRGAPQRTLLRTRDGSLRAIADSAALIRDTRGAQRGVVLVFRDQSVERAAERALRESELRFKHLAYSGILGIIIADTHGKIYELNDTFLRMVDYTRHDFEAGRVKLSDLTPPEWKAGDQIALQHFRGAGSVRARKKEYFRRDGSRVPVLVGGATLDAPRFIAFVLDLTEQRQAEMLGARAVATAEQESKSRARVEQTLRQTEEQLRQSQKMEAIGTLAGSVAHDFNNLLSVILSYSDLLMDALPSSDPMRADLEQITRAGRRAEDLTRQLLAFSRQQVLEPKVVDFSEAIQGMAKMLSRLIGEDIELTLLPGRGLGMVFVDPTQIEQVVLNLVVNARDAMPRGGKLTIESADVEFDGNFAAEHLGVEPGAYVMLSVSDTGMGMDQATQSRIFEPFFTTKPRGKGTGLGLSTVFGIVKQSGGSIWVYSEPGKGTTFKIYLPRAAATRKAEERAIATPTTLQGWETILLTEDDQQVRELACIILRKNGYHVLEAATPGDALLICEQYQATIHLLLTDVVMPRIGGRKLWERLAPIRPGMKVLFMSGYADDAIVHHGVLSSEFAFVQKPLMPTLLLAKLRSVLDSQRRSELPPASERAKLALGPDSK
jgi:PAS domain S-box-containing protein